MNNINYTIWNGIFPIRIRLESKRRKEWMTPKICNTVRPQMLIPILPGTLHVVMIESFEKIKRSYDER